MVFSLQNRATEDDEERTILFVGEVGGKELGGGTVGGRGEEGSVRLICNLTARAHNPPYCIFTPL